MARQVTVTGEHDCLGRIWRDGHCDPPTIVEFEHLGDELARFRVGTRRLPRFFGTGCRMIHGRWVPCR
jgi:hypothetical protein